MTGRIISLPELGLIAGTRAALGAGVGLLLADRLNNDQRKAIGWTLVAVGVLSTVPLAAHVLLGEEASQRSRQRPQPTQAADEEHTSLAPGV